MDGDQKLGALAIVVSALILGGVVLGGVECSRQREESFRACLASGAPPAECAMATEEASR